MWRGIIEQYRQFLPVSGQTPIVTLFEGNTPLIRAERLEKHLKFDGAIYLKDEGKNPTGSFKDRGMTLAVSKALEEGSRAIICASTGNTSASEAAYGAKAGIKTLVVVPHQGIALGKLAQALVYGAQIISVKGNFDDCLRVVREICQKYPVTLMNSLNPYRLEGQKTAAFEICEELGRFPDYHFIPVGNGGNITAYYQGYREYYLYQHKKLPKNPPKMMGWQAAGAAPIVLGHAVAEPQTVASAIRIGNPARWQDASEAAKNSGGQIDMVTDQEILEAYKLIARTEGIFCEPASAVPVAGLIKVQKAKLLKEAAVVVCTLTGNGLKDPDAALKTVKRPKSIDPDLNKIIKKIEF